jgi:hypothetical protein
MQRTWLSLAIVSAVACLAAQARAGFIADENAKPGTDWQPHADGTAAVAGVIDMYPGAWSMKQGDTLELKIRSTTPYDLEIFRLGWYGSVGSRIVATRPGQPANPQPYPTSADPATGLVAAKWSTTVSIPLDASWVPGVYVARGTQAGTGLQGMTVFVIRDDGAAVRAPILFVVPLNTHEAYNAWPGPMRGGHSLYPFNSALDSPTETTGSNQAVKVSFDRPMFVGVGTADVSLYEYPMVRFLERNGYDIAYAIDSDIHSNPSLLLGRKMVFVVGHSEYWSHAAFDAVLAARDAGVNFFFATGDTLNWQIRYEDGVQTIVAYKESGAKDPELAAAQQADAAHDDAAALAHYGNVSIKFRDLPSGTLSDGKPFDTRRPGIVMTGVQTAGKLNGKDGMGNSPWADFIIDDPTFWMWKGPQKCVRIPNVFGYEVDTSAMTDPSFDPWRPKGQIRLGEILEPWTSTVKGSGSFYRAASGAEVIAMGAIAFSWSVDPFAAPGDSTVPCSQQMVTNAVARWTSAQPQPAPATQSTSAPYVSKSHPQTASEDSGGCAYGSSGLGASGAVLATMSAATLARRRRARRSAGSR